MIECAGVLHDFGKVGLREKVLVKAKKLYEEDRRAVELRFALIPRTLEAEQAERKLRLALELGRDQIGGRFEEIDAELARKRAELDEAWAFIVKANEPALLEEGGLERLVEIAHLQ